MKLKRALLVGLASCLSVGAIDPRFHVKPGDKVITAREGRYGLVGDESVVFATNPRTGGITIRNHVGNLVAGFALVHIYRTVGSVQGFSVGDTVVLQKQGQYGPYGEEVVVAGVNPITDQITIRNKSGNLIPGWSPRDLSLVPAACIRKLNP